MDPAARDYILRTIIQNRRPNSSVLISTHLIADIEQVLDEALFINQGRILLHENTTVYVTNTENQSMRSSVEQFKVYWNLMFGKLMKYELKATYKWYLIISGVLLFSLFCWFYWLLVLLLSQQVLQQDTTLYDCWDCCLVIFAGYIGLTDQLYHYYSSFYNVFLVEVRLIPGLCQLALIPFYLQRASKLLIWVSLFLAWSLSLVIFS